MSEKNWCIADIYDDGKELHSACKHVQSQVSDLQKQVAEMRQSNACARSSLAFIAGFYSSAKDDKSQECRRIALKTLEEMRNIEDK